MNYMFMCETIRLLGNVIGHRFWVLTGWAIDQLLMRMHFSGLANIPFWHGFFG